MADEENEEDEKLTGYVYAPNSIYRGCRKMGFSAAQLLRIENGRLTDFIEFLFEHSEHCDHISQRDAWEEFEVWEAEQAKEWRGTPTDVPVV